MDMIAQFNAARRVSTPIVAISTPDPAQTMLTLQSEVMDAPCLSWDLVRGLIALNRPGEDALAQALGNASRDRTINPVAFLTFAQNLPERTTVFMLQAHRFLQSEAVTQAIWLLRDLFKANERTLILLGPEFLLPPEIAQDVLLLEEPLPNEAALTQIIADQYDAGQLNQPSMETKDAAVSALLGLSAFSAEQATAISLEQTGLNLRTLWEKKRAMIEQTRGLSVWRGGETFEQIGGVEMVKSFLRLVLRGRRPIRAIVFIDEIEKQFAGATTDTSGVSQGYLGTLLSYMQDQQATGVIFIGPPGSAKSMVAKAAGAEVNIPTIALDLNGLKSQFVGSSETALRTALKVITAVSQGRSLWIVTCNSIGVLPPELRRRFKLGTFFFDLPSSEERSLIWTLYKKQYTLNSPVPADEGWTGAEIAQCAELAWQLGISLIEASAFIVPIAISAADQIQRLRDDASGKFLSASYPGVYRQERPSPVNSGRRVTIRP